MEINQSLSIIIPAYNEDQRIGKYLDEILDFISNNQKVEIIVVDDGSTDSTAKLIQSYENKDNRIKLISLPENRGKGFAVKTGMMVSTNDLVLFTDADGSTPIKEIYKLIDGINEGYDLVIASRALQSEDTSISTLWYRKLLGRTFNFFINTFLIPDIADTQCGFKLFKKASAKFLFSQQISEGFSFDFEILFLARKIKLKFKEVPVNWENVPGSKVNLFLDALRMFFDIFIFKIIHSDVNKKNFKASIVNQEIS